MSITLDKTLINPFKLSIWDAVLMPQYIVEAMFPTEAYAIPGIRKVYFNNRHTTIEWEDGVKTTVGCIEGQEFDDYGGFAAAVLKRLFGSSSAAFRYMNEHKEVQPDTDKKSKAKDEAVVNQDA